ncbi:hypothetical protein B9Z65_6346 [Elsinoe australis]|uniref:HPP transmembrane region domain-containing protein n=1 Tax=Elsinoe australis TaxID=40998 RepID=A0A2P8A8D1_9PEZI|nr:hypothetical protein B9Z65_6346 [Elsinoe australis]
MVQSTILNHILNFDIDTLFNPYLPPSILPHLPIPLSYPLGHRRTPPPQLPPTIQTLLSLLATFLGLLTVTSISNFSPQLSHIANPVLIPSLGAGAVLNYVTPNLPAAQPRPTIFGQIISAAVGVGVSKLFTHADDGPGENFANLVWLAAPTAVAAAVLAMRLTNTVHPPGGATAALTVATSSTRTLGWWLVALVAIGTSTMVGVGLVVNNLGRKWPEFWWSPGEMGGKLPGMKKGKKEEESEKGGDEEKGAEGSESGSELEKARSNEGSEVGFTDGVCRCCGRGG